MDLMITRENLLIPLQLVSGAVERRQTLPILGNVLLSAAKGNLSVTATDLEVELIGHIAAETIENNAEITVPGRKFLDIIRALPDAAEIALVQQGDKLIIKSGKSRFSLSTLPAKEFPNVEENPPLAEFELAQSALKTLLEKVYFAMAHQDVRYYLNGMLFDISPQGLKVVATDGHRLAMGQSKETVFNQKLSVILPRKGVVELLRLLSDSDEKVVIKIAANHLQAVTPAFTFTSKLIDGKFPDYQRVIPQSTNKTAKVDAQVLKQCLSRAAILSNQKYRGIRLSFISGFIKLFANNPEHEEAEEELPADYQDAPIEFGFNVNYLLDIVSTLSAGELRFSFTDTNNSILVEGASDQNFLYVVMPMRL